MRGSGKVGAVVCIKQTPVAAEARFDEATKTLVREGVTLTISSLDRRALLEALRFRDEVGGTVTVGPGLRWLHPAAARSAITTTEHLPGSKCLFTCLCDCMRSGGATAGASACWSASGIAPARFRAHP